MFAHKHTPSQLICFVVLMNENVNCERKKRIHSSFRPIFFGACTCFSSTWFNSLNRIFSTYICRTEKSSCRYYLLVYLYFVNSKNSLSFELKIGNLSFLFFLIIFAVAVFLFFFLYYNWLNVGAFYLAK